MGSADTPQGWPPELSKLGYRCGVSDGAVWWWRDDDTETPGIETPHRIAVPAAIQQAVVEARAHYGGTRECALKQERDRLAESIERIWATLSRLGDSRGGEVSAAVERQLTEVTQERDELREQLKGATDAIDKLYYKA